MVHERKKVLNHYQREYPMKNSFFSGDEYVVFDILDNDYAMYQTNSAMIVKVSS